MDSPTDEEFHPNHFDYPDCFDEKVEELFQDERVEAAQEEIVRIIGEQLVVTDRELKVRLERAFFPWVVGRALGVLLDTGAVRKVGYAGRRKVSAKVTESFFCLPETRYNDIVAIIAAKRRISADVINLLTGEASATIHAEDLFYDAFDSLEFELSDRDISEFRGNKATGVPGKEPPNVDFVAERDGLAYGVDVKNWIRYEADTRNEVEHKVKVALALRTIPFIIARYVDQDTIYTRIHTREANYGMTYRYETLLVPSSMESLAREANKLLGYPILAADNLPSYKVEWIEKLHQIRLALEKGHKRD